MMKIRAFIVFSCLFFPALCAADDTLLQGIKGADRTLYGLYRDLLEKDYDSAMEYAAMFLERVDTCSASYLLADMSNAVAQWEEMEKFAFSKAVIWREYSYHQYVRLNDHYRQAKTQYNLAKLWLKLGQYHKTLECVMSASRYFEKEDMLEDLMECYKLLAVIYSTCKDYERSDEYFQRYIQAASAVNDSAKMFVGLNNKAAFASMVGDTVMTVKLLYESIRMAHNTQNSDSWLCELYLNLAGAYLNPKTYDSCGVYLAKAEPLLSNLEQRGHYHVIKADLCIALNDVPNAVDNLNKAVYWYGQGEFDDRIIDIYEKLQNLYIFQRDTAKAYLTVFAKEKLEKKNPKEEVLIELFKAQNEIQLNAVKDEVTRHKNRLTILLITTVSAALILILIILFLLVKRTYDIKRREVEMDNKAKIAELKKIQQYKEDRIMKETADKLSLLESQVKDSDVKDKINVIRNELKGAKDDNEWKEFARYIPEFNGPFYKNLTKAFPNLSINESRMCVLLNRNLSTKQISAITGQKPESINIARTRLRKKLGIAGNPISIQEFLRRYDM